MFTTSGQLAIKTIITRTSRFNVGQLLTSFGEFYVKNPAFEQYAEGKYDGEFTIRLIKSESFAVGSRIVTHTRAWLDGMTLTAIDALDPDDAERIPLREVDPLDQEPSAPLPKATPEATPQGPILTVDPLSDPTPFGMGASSTSLRQASTEADDPALFGALWPLDHSVKLDATVDRRLFRRQLQRLGQLDYAFDPLSQVWHRNAA